MLPDKIEHCIVFMNYWDVSGVFWSFSKCNIKIPHLPADPSNIYSHIRGFVPDFSRTLGECNSAGGESLHTYIFIKGDRLV